MDRNVKKYLTAENLSVLLLASYLFGFILWNIFLGVYGFFEFNLLQTRFVSAGLMFLLISSTLYFVILRKKPEDLLNFQKRKLVYFIIYFLFYAYLIFPTLPQAIGGAAPFGVFLLGSEDQISYLVKFNIPTTPDSKVETTPVCEIYSNTEQLVIGASSLNLQQTGYGTFSAQITGQRVMILHQNQISGTQPVGPTYFPSSLSSMECTGFYLPTGLFEMLRSMLPKKN